MESSLFPPQAVKITNSSGSVCNRRTFHAGIVQSEGKPQTQVHPKRNRLKLAKTYRISDNVGNKPSHVTGSPESTALCKGMLFTDAVIKTTDDKNKLIQEEHHLQTGNKLTIKMTSNVNKMSVQLASTPAKREHASSESSLKPAIDYFGSNKEALTRFLRTETADTDNLMDQPKINIGQIQQTTKHDPVQHLNSLNSTKPSRIEPTNVRTVREMRLGWRKETPSEISSELLKDIQKLNLQFPVQRFFTLLKKKGTASVDESSALEAQMSDNYKQHSTFCVERKRKQELEDQYRTYKHHRTNKGIRSTIKDFEPLSDVLVNPHSKYTNRLSRTKCRQQQTTFCAVVTEPVQNDSIYQNPSLRMDDVLWTDKYQPQQSSEVIGNSASIQQLQSWLKEWKTRADAEERRRRQDERMKKAESWDCGDFVGDAVSIDQVKELCNTVLITGPSGVGKTAAVYACAQELGFKVFEVNSSVLRCGRLLLSQLTEATQSHQMDLESIKPSALKSESEIINQNQIKPAPVSSTGKEAHRKVATSSSSKETSVCHSDSHNIRKPQPVKLTHFFKLSSKKSVVKASDGPERCMHATAVPDRLQRSGSGFKEKGGKKSASKNQSRAIPVSLILFEEVDVIFPEDVGFLTAIKTFMSTSKRPIILTTNDPLFGARLKGRFDEIHFRTPSLQTIRSYLQCLCAVENMKTDPEYMAFLLCQNRGDIRQSILQLQLWVCSGGGSTELQILQNTLKCRSWTELKNSRCLEILAEKTGGGLLYFIIGSLFSPSFSSQSFYLQDSSNPNTKGVKSESLMLQTPTTVYERKSACRGKAISYPHSVKASDPSKQTNKLAFEPDVRGQSESLIFHPVLCIGRFFDNMSFVDACLQKPSLNRNELCKTEALGWMGAKLKDSLLDFQREEQIRQNFENCSQLLAFVEVLSFHCCQTELSGIWTETARLRENMSSERWKQMMAFFSQPFGQKQLPTCYCKFCEPRAAQKHRELASMLISSRKICCLRNKRAFFMDYLPTLRSICRSERVKGQHSIRHSHYLSSFHLPRSTLELMALDFP